MCVPFTEWESQLLYHLRHSSHSDWQDLMFDGDQTLQFFNKAFTLPFHKNNFNWWASNYLINVKIQCLYTPAQMYCVGNWTLSWRDTDCRVLQNTALLGCGVAGSYFSTTDSTCAGHFTKPQETLITLDPDPVMFCGPSPTQDWYNPGPTLVSSVHGIVWSKWCWYGQIDKRNLYTSTLIGKKISTNVKIT